MSFGRLRVSGQEPVFRESNDAVPVHQVDWASPPCYNIFRRCKPVSGSSSAVELRPSKTDVVGSNPISRSIVVTLHAIFQQQS